MGLFAPESPLMTFLNRLTDVILINLFTFAGLIPLMCLLLTVIGFLPVNALTVILSVLSFASGAALTAMHYCLLKLVRGEETYTVPSFFKACRDNFKQATVLFLLLAAVAAVLVTDLSILSSQEESPLFQAMYVLCGAALVLLFMISLYLFPLQAHFTNPVRATIKNALLIAIYAFPRTLAMIAIYAAEMALLYLIGIHFFPFLLFIGIAGPAFLCACLYSSVFKRFEPEDE